MKLTVFNKYAVAIIVELVYVHPANTGEWNYTSSVVGGKQI